MLTYMTLESLRSGHYSLTPKDKERNVHHGMLFCWVEGAFNLISADGASKSDPYCTLWCQNDKKSTHAMKDTLDPEWNEYYEWPNVSASETLFIEVHDKGTMSDKLLGRGKIPIADVAQRFNDDNSLDSLKVNLSLETTPGTKGTKGDIILHLEWIPLDALPIPKSRTKAEDSLFAEVERGVLYVRLVHGRGLKNVDALGKSDPYVKFKIAGGERKSKIINNNLNPDWNETFKWDSTKAADVVKIEVKDDDVFKNQVLGVYEISVSYAVKPPATVQTFKCKLIDRSPKKKPGQSAGYLVIQMYWAPWNSFGDESQPPEPEWPAVAEQ
ncbi:unnamed protein product [Ostreobium quekettii]|uniref:C2 domain-containing protein n=1 Tax=Ostreobium quekettii TaxID=121088 RepID=A0A8S1JF72_9CHLO|nr:unnamed protein product [Ostreobium quekettii]